MEAKLGVWLAAASIAGSVSAEDLQSMMRRCVPEVHPTTLSAIVHVESAGHAYVISDDGPEGLPWSQRKTMLRSFYPASKDEAVRLVESLLAQRHLVGIGPMQVSVRNVRRLGMTVQDAFDTCTNLRLGGRVLVEQFLSASKKYRNQQEALLAAVSAYNTGNFENGFKNGYVQKVVNASQYRVPEIKYGRSSSSAGQIARKGGMKNSPPNRTSNEARALAARYAKIEVESF